MHRHLTQSIRWNLRHLKWVPHTLSEPEQVKREQGTTGLLDEKSIESSSGFQRMKNREQGQGQAEVLVTTTQC
jgi:hypothetical protein